MAESTKERKLKVFIVLAHPDPRSLNAALARYATEILQEAGHEVKVSDLYAMNFKAVLDSDDFPEYDGAERVNFFKESYRAYTNGSQTPDVVEEQEKMKWADILIMQFPFWWYNMPAIMKGWVDRVYAAGFAYLVGERTETRYYDRFGEGMMAGKRAMCMITVGNAEEHHSARGIGGPIDDLLWQVHHGIFFFPGYEVLPPFLVYRSLHVDEQRFEEIKAELKQRLLTLDTTPFIPYRKQNGGDYEIPRCLLKPGLEREGEHGFDMHIKK